MREIWTRAFSRSYDAFSRTDRITLDKVLDELLERHDSADMRHSIMSIADERVWATRRIHLSHDVVRVSWMYEQAPDTIVMLTVASIETV
jgi:hypothetical protein